MGSDGLVAGLDQDLVDCHVVGLGERVDDRRGNVFGIEDTSATDLPVEVQRLLVAAQSAEVRGDVAGLDGGHLEPRARRLQPQALRESLDEKLARGVDREPGEHLAPGVRGDGDYVPASNGAQQVHFERAM
jgi:hypothetical protein